MRNKTVRSGIRSISYGIMCLIAATFFHTELATILPLGLEGEARLTFFGFFMAGALGGFGVLVAAMGLLQSGAGQPRVRLVPSFLLLVSLVALFFFLTYNSVTTPPPPRLEPGESIDI